MRCARAPSTWAHAWAPSGRSPTRSPPRPSTGYCTLPTGCSRSQPPRRDSTTPRSGRRSSRSRWPPSPGACTGRTACRCWDDGVVSDTAAAIEVHALSKRYGDFEAVRGIDISVQRGEVFGLLGPNGAGKTTTVEILEGYRGRTGGEVSVLGHDPGRRSRALRQRIGIVLQSSGMYNHVTPREALCHWASFYPSPRDVEDVIALVGLEEKADERSRTLSGGQLRRLDFALAMVGDPG